MLSGGKLEYAAVLNGGKLNVKGGTIDHIAVSQRRVERLGRRDRRAYHISSGGVERPSGGTVSPAMSSGLAPRLSAGGTVNVSLSRGGKFVVFGVDSFRHFHV